MSNVKRKKSHNHKYFNFTFFQYLEQVTGKYCLGLKHDRAYQLRHSPNILPTRIWDDIAKALKLSPDAVAGYFAMWAQSHVAPYPHKK